MNEILNGLNPKGDARLLNALDDLASASDPSDAATERPIVRVVGGIKGAREKPPVAGATKGTEGAERSSGGSDRTS